MEKQSATAAKKSLGVRKGRVVFEPGTWMYTIHRDTDVPFDVNLYQFIAAILQLERGDYKRNDTIDPNTIEITITGDDIHADIQVGLDVTPEQIALWVFNAKVVCQMELQRQIVLRAQQQLIQQARREGKGAIWTPEQVGMGGAPGRIVPVVDPRLVHEVEAQERQMRQRLQRYGV